MKFITRLIISLLSIAVSIVGSIWGGFEILDIRMDRKVKQGERRVIHIVESLRQERNILINQSEEKTMGHIELIRADLTEIKRDIKTLIKASGKNSFYSKIKNRQEATNL